MAIAKTSYLLDTSAYSGFGKGDPRLRPWFDAKHIILIPLIVVGELRAGFAAGSKTAENERFLDLFLNSSAVQTLSLTLETTKHFTSLFLQMRKAGSAISSNDLWIAALAIEHTIPILTLDADFQRIKGVEVITI